MSKRTLEEWFKQVSGDVLIVSEAVPSRTVMKRHFWEPRTDLFEDERHLIVRCELAGVSSEDISIFYLPDRHSLILRGIRHEEDLPGAEKKCCHQLEVYFGEFEREVALPDTPVEPQLIRAQYRAGFLYVLVPKSRLTVRHVRMTIRKS